MRNLFDGGGVILHPKITHLFALQNHPPLRRDFHNGFWVGLQGRRVSA
jgi:hypothetical protein